MKQKYSKSFSLILIFIIYSLAIIAAFVTYEIFKHLGILISVFLADVVATIIVWLAGIILKNSSVYDPYWSVTPMIVIPIWLAIRNTSLTLADILLLIAVFFWGSRLTLNWVMSWQGLNHVDWRYDMLKQKMPKLWILTNFGGINMMPTIIVYSAMIPAYYYIFNFTKVNLFTYIGFIICIMSALLQLISDKQMKNHRKLKPQEHIDNGLWKYSRHPNYFGEVMFWWGIFIMQFSLSNNSIITIIGAVFMTTLFVFISIPMMEKHIIQKYDGYLEYRSRVSMLVPWFRKK